MSQGHMRGIKSFFEPKSVAVAGVSTDPDKLGSIIFANMLANSKRGLLKAPVYALNPAHRFIGDQPCYPTVDSLPQTPELLIVAVPESRTLGVVKEAAEAGVKAVVMVTSGYAEVGRGDVEKEIGRVAAAQGMRVLGPNTIGLLDMRSGVDSLFLRPTKTLRDGSQIVALLEPLKGDVAIITQSGHLGEIISEELAASGVGIRALVGTGNQLDVSVEDVIEYFADDRQTKVMAVYIEGLHDGRRFMRAATRAARKKPLVVFKVGKTDVGARAALTHTASLVGDYQVSQAAFSQSGVIEATSLEELVDYSISLSMLPGTAGRRLVIVTNAGGVGAIAADEAEKVGLEVKPLRLSAERRLRSEFKGAGFIENASLANPMDLTASVTTEEFVNVAESLLALPDYDLALLLPTHQAPAIGFDVATRLGKVLSKTKKPVAMCVMGTSEMAAKVRREFMAGGSPSFPTPERAVHALAAVPAYENLRGKAREPADGHGKVPFDFGRLRGPLPQPQVSRLLRRYGIREPKSAVVRSHREVERLGLGFPVTCKLLAKGLVHKKDVGGVVVGVKDAKEAGATLDRFSRVASSRGLRFEGMLVQEMVEGGIEVILGGTRDPTFGPVVVFGLGGTYTELIRDYSLMIAPATAEEVRDVLGRSKLGKVLGGYRGGQVVDVGSFSEVVSRFSRIMVENPSIEQMEVNPLVVTEEGSTAVDARVVLAK